MQVENLREQMLEVKLELSSSAAVSALHVGKCRRHLGSERVDRDQAQPPSLRKTHSRIDRGHLCREMLCSGYTTSNIWS